jgi:hypothetical protein
MLHHWGTALTISASDRRACRFLSSLLPYPGGLRSTGLACPLLFSACIVSINRGMAYTEACLHLEGFWRGR